MRKVCKVCGKNSYSDFCAAHKPRKAIKKTFLQRKSPKPKKAEPTGKGAKKQGGRKRTVKYLKSILTRTFSVYIRLRNADKNGIVTCFTSGQQMFWKQSQCGHFQSRRFNATMFDERNNQVQSPADNLFLQGNQYIYGKKLDELYGAGTADELVALSRTEYHFDIEWLEERIKHYQKEVSRLKKQKGL